MPPGHHPAVLEEPGDLERRPGAFEGPISDGEATEVERKPRAASASPRGRMGKRTMSGQRDGLQARPRSSTVRRSSASSPEPLTLAGKSQMIREPQSVAEPISQPKPVEVEDYFERRAQDVEHERPSSPSLMSTVTTKTNRSGSSSGSGSTVTQVSYRRKSLDKEREKELDPGRYRSRSFSPHVPEQPDIMSFLEPDSPDITDEMIQRTLDETTRWRSSGNSPTARSASSSTSSSFTSEVFSEPAGDHETDGSSSPEHSIDGDSPVTAAATARLQAQLVAAHHRQRRHRSYGTPEMPRGKAIHPHIPPNALQPRLAVPHQSHIKPLPRAEKLPLTGYELLASKLSAGSPGGSTIKPLYRRFEALNHRLLLHLQDELAELEEQLHRLDTADTQTRRAQDCILPASRRSEYMAGGELQWHKSDILGKIGFKLGQYNHVLSSFTSTQGLPSPELTDINDYRSYLSRHNPIAEIETRFLDPMEDLVSLARPPSSSSDTVNEEDAQTPMPRRVSDSVFLPCSPSPDACSSVSAPAKSGPIEKQPDKAAPEGTLPTLPQLAVGMAVAFLLPILTFSVIPGFVGRMIVVLLVGLGVMSGLIQAGLARLTGEGSATMGIGDWLLCGGVYGGVMAVVAGLIV